MRYACRFVLNKMVNFLQVLRADPYESSCWIESGLLRGGEESEFHIVFIECGICLPAPSVWLFCGIFLFAKPESKYIRLPQYQVQAHRFAL